MSKEFYIDCIQTVLDHVQFSLKIPIDIRPVWNEDKPSSSIIENGGAYCEIDKGYFIVHIHEDIQNIIEPIDFETGTKYRILPYLESLDIEISEKSVFLFTLLHELGHLSVFEKFEKCGLVSKYDEILKSRISDQSILDYWIIQNNIQYNQY
ncbi:hypothetical protein HQN90_00695 [Paenibacillus alba]|uniref:hypothetical protein n=1 Tax=Paenibacillus alba TaxID=1197127 RepID=UPI001564621A|nr:hypothetical protein [Paenibacillus alba]NQX64633.1 hypothetical protein [Paenibacillus alba]